MAADNAKILRSVEVYARRSCADHDPAHDALHLQRVVSNARWIIESESSYGTSISRVVVEAACWLHDLVQLPKRAGSAGESARQSAMLAAEFLHRLNIDHETISGVEVAIQSHSYSGRNQARTIEAAILQDADRLDALGAVGIARLWVVTARSKSLLYDQHDPAAHRRNLDDSSYALDHICAKLLKLPALMNTATGRRIATERAKFVEEFRAAFLGEINWPTE